MTKKEKLKNLYKKDKVRRGVKGLYYAALGLLLPVAFTSFSISFREMIVDPFVSAVSFVIGFATFTIFLLIAITFSVLKYSARREKKLEEKHEKQAEALRNEIKELREGATLTLSAATTQLNDIVEKMADGTLVMRPETEFNITKPSSEPLITIRQLIMPQKKEGEK